MCRCRRKCQCYTVQPKQSACFPKLRRGNATLEAPTFRFHSDLQSFFRVAQSDYVWVSREMFMVEVGVARSRDCR